MNSNSEVLAVKSLVKTYVSGKNKVQALKGINLTLYKGEMLAIMGSSGSGKSTLLNLIGALDSATGGKIVINGTEIKDYFQEPYATKYRSENIGFVFQAYNLLKDLTVEENVALPLILKDADKKDIKNKTAKMVDLVGLNKWKGARPVELSGGQQQRVAIARALITSPPILLADEPTGNLDYNTTNEIMNVIEDMKEKLTQSIILVTHDPMVASFADRIVFLSDGNIIDEYKKTDKRGNISEILDRFKLMLEVKNG